MKCSTTGHKKIMGQKKYNAKMIIKDYNYDILLRFNENENNLEIISRALCSLKTMSHF